MNNYSSSRMDNNQSNAINMIDSNANVSTVYVCGSN